MAKMTRFGFALVGGLGLLTAFGAFKGASYMGWIGKPTNVVAVVPLKTRIEQFHVEDIQSSYDLPASRVTAVPTKCAVMETLAWNAVSGAILANGGPSTQRGSFVDKYTGGGCLEIKRQDDYTQMYANMAKAISSGTGDQFFIIMGDAGPYVASALNTMGLKGQYSAISTIGFSDGEDQCMLPSNWRDLMKSGTPILIAAVARDGDWNICVKFASDNNIKINVNQKTVVLDAFNFTDVDSFTAADEKLIGGVMEDRVVVKDGIAHNSMKVKPNGVATWTPGDKDVVKRYPGSITGVASTADYKGQMPAMIFGAKDWMAKNHDYVVGLLKAFDRGAMAIRVNQAYDAMDAANQMVFQDKGMSPGDWAAYYKGMRGTNGAGESVRLGGSKVATLQEARDYFGLSTGTTDTYESVYRTFKKYDEDFYPEMFPASTDKAIPAYSDVVDLTYLKDALKDIPATAKAPNAVSVASLMPTPMSRVVASKSVHIEFDTGRATIRPSSVKVLQDILDSAAISSGLSVRLSGYTDDTGSAAVNVPLSLARAQAVADYLHNKAPVNFPKAHFEVHGYGPGDVTHPPLCTDDTADCREQNRRVVVEQGD